MTNLPSGSNPGNENLDRQSVTVVFLHIPKTAGQTLYAILDREYGRQNIYTFQGGRQRLKQSIAEFCALPMAARNSFALLRGHISFGVQAHISRPFRYITMLRDPVTRIISHYYYVQKTTSHALHEQVTTQNMSLRDYVTADLSSELDNGQTRLLSGVGNSVPIGECTTDLLEQAITNIESHFVTVGLTERFDESVLLMKVLLRWRKMPLYTKKNVSKRPLTRDNPSEEVIRLIRMRNQLDCKLYTYAQQRFDRQITALPEKIFERFRLLNRLYYPYGRFKSRARSLVKQLKR